MNPQLAQMYLAALGGGSGSNIPNAAPATGSAFSPQSALAQATASPAPAISQMQDIMFENPQTIQQNARTGAPGGIRGTTPQNPGAAAFNPNAPQQPSQMPFGW
jgi:hypothetical protein